MRAGFPAARRAALLELRAEASYAADDQLKSIADLNEAIALHRLDGDVGKEADAMCRLVPTLACRGLVDEARAAAEGAVELLAATPERHENARALAALAHLHLYDDHFDAAIEVGWRAASVAAAFDDAEVGTEATITAAFAQLRRDGPEHEQALEAALAMARAHDLTTTVPRALNNLAFAAVEHRDHALAERWIEEGIAYTDGHDLDLWRLSILSIRLWLELNQGRWDDAVDTAELLIGDLRDSPGPRIDAFLVLALVRARRGDPGAPDALAEAVTMTGAGYLVDGAAREHRRRDRLAHRAHRPDRPGHGNRLRCRRAAVVAVVAWRACPVATPRRPRHRRDPAAARAHRAGGRRPAPSGRRRLGATRLPVRGRRRAQPRGRRR